MSNYKFECQCIPCLCEWPVYTGMTKSVAKKGMSGKANEIKGVYANIHKQTTHDVQVKNYDGFFCGPNRYISFPYRSVTLTESVKCGLHSTTKQKMSCNSLTRYFETIYAQ